MTKWYSLMWYSLYHGSDTISIDIKILLSWITLFSYLSLLLSAPNTFPLQIGSTTISPIQFIITIRKGSKVQLSSKTAARLPIASFEPINFNIALTGDDYAASDSTYSATTVPTFSDWSEWGSCAPNCGPSSIRSRTRSCNSQYCAGAIEDTEACSVASCTTDKHECIADSQGTKWRPIILQYRENGGIPKDQYDCIRKAGFQFRTKVLHGISP